MKKLCILMTAIPFFIFAENLEEDFLFLAEEQDPLLNQFIAEDECYEQELSVFLGDIELGDFNNTENFPVFGPAFKEDVEPLLPWSDDRLAKKNVDTSIKKEENSSEVSKDYVPTFESVPKRSGYFALRPRIITSKTAENKAVTTLKKDLTKPKASKKQKNTLRRGRKSPQR